MCTELLLEPNEDESNELFKNIDSESGIYNKLHAIVNDENVHVLEKAAILAIKNKRNNNNER